MVKGRQDNSRYCTSQNRSMPTCFLRQTTAKSRFDSDSCLLCDSINERGATREVDARVRFVQRESIRGEGKTRVPQA
jgi:hypothetical protein